VPVAAEPLREAAGMVKLVYALRRLPHLSREEFQRYWREVHAPLVAERASVLGIRRYVQCHTRSDAGSDAAHAGFQARNGGSPAPFDGFAELWFEPPASDRSEADAQAAAQAAAELLDDERNFIDLPNSPATMTDEHHIVGAERRLLVPTSDHDGTLAWHAGLFGWEVVRQWPGGTLLAIDDHTRLEILEGNADFPPVPSLEGTAFVVEVPDVAAVYTAAVARGATVVQPPQDKPWGHRNLILRDPNGLAVVAFEVR